MRSWGVEDQLLDTFGVAILSLRIKQLIGHMVKQIMKAHVYVVDRQGVRIVSCQVFSKGTRYRRA